MTFLQNESFSTNSELCIGAIRTESYDLEKISKDIADFWKAVASTQFS
jgi:hypothetical protein